MDAPAITLAGPAPRRRPRDWVVDSLLFLFAVIFALLAVGGWLESPTPPGPGWLFTVDVAAGAVGCAAVWLRRRWPVGLALFLIALATFSETVAGAMVVGLFTVAIHRPPRTTAAVFALSVLAALVYAVLRPEPGTPSLILFLVGVIIQGLRSAGACSSTSGASSWSRCATGRSGPRPRRSCGPSRPSSVPGTTSPGRCTTCSATGCRC